VPGQQFSSQGAVGGSPLDSAVRAHLSGALQRARREATPFTHWRFGEILPPGACEAIAALPFPPPRIAETMGRRETNNSTRLFFSPDIAARFPLCRALCAALNAPALVEQLEQLCGTPLAHGLLRIEYCQDTDGFWLEPHTDIGAKLLTMLIYVSADAGSGDLGTDLMDATGATLATVPYRANSGFIFVPGSDTWHGFRKRPIPGVRRTLIVNFVKPEWRSRHELAFPDQSFA
jgi:hypothetical protein